MWLLSILLLIQAPEAVDTPTYYLDEIVVYGELAPYGLSARFTLKPESLGLEGLSLEEALLTFSGFHYTVGRKGRPIPSLRGFPERNLLVMVDGVPVQSPYDGSIDLSSIPVFNAERVQILGGTLASLFSPNAMGGVINIVTRRPGPHPTVGGWISADLSGAKSHIFLSERLGSLGLSLSCGVEGSRGFYLSRNFREDINEDGRLRENSDFFRKSLSLKVDERHDRNAFALSFYLLDYPRGIPPQTDIGRPRYWRFNVWRDGLVSISVSRRCGSGTFGLDVYEHFHLDVLDSYDDSTYSTQTEPYAFRSRFRDLSKGANFKGNFLWGGFLLRGGLYLREDLHREKNESEGWSSYRSTTFSVPMGFEFPLRGGLFLTVGSGIHVGKLRETTLSIDPLLGFSAEIGEAAARLVLSRRTRFPTLKELYSEYLGRCTPNPDLGPESSLNAEVSISLKKGAVYVNSSLYLSELRDMIERKRVGVDSTGRKIYQMKNVGRARIRGLEINAGQRIGRTLKLGLSLTLLSAVELDNARLWVPMPHRPSYRLTLTALAELRRGFAASFRGNLTGPYRDPDGEEISSRFLADVGLRKEAGPLTLSLEADNLFDLCYSYEKGFPGPGRRVRFEIAIKGFGH